MIERHVRQISKGMIPEVDDPSGEPARQLEEVVDGPARVDLPLGQLGHLVPEQDPALQVKLAFAVRA